MCISCCGGPGGGGGAHCGGGGGTDMLAAADTLLDVVVGDCDDTCQGGTEDVVVDVLVAADEPGQFEGEKRPS